MICLCLCQGRRVSAACLHANNIVLKDSALTSSADARAKVRLYYAAEGAFYTASIFMLVAWEERRKDFHVMMVHHLATSVLIAASYLLSCAPSLHRRL